MPPRPRSLRIRTYQVGFGDCFLLTFRYANFDRNVLIDFGSTAKPKRAPKLDRIAKKIRDDCGGKLDGVVATHRHKDHIAGFATRAAGNGPGDVIAACEPEVVVQPWTEDPDAAPDAKKPTRVYSARSRSFVGSLGQMQRVAGSMAEISAKGTDAPRSLAATLHFMGDNNISNRSAVENLIQMGRSQRAAFVHFGSRSGLERRLPGVDVRVLGPPTLVQSDAIRRQRSRDADEFWQLQAAAAASLAREADTGRPKKVFPRAEAFKTRPPWSRWLTTRLGDLRADTLLQIVRALDDEMNNTSVILLFRIGRMSLLFPGDAQIENWSYALGQASVRRLLRSVDLYKVGHHGSLNATPKSLWELFANRARDESDPQRLFSMNSTMGGKHGHRSRRTEVPRRTLVEALENETHYITTQSIRSTRTFWKDVEVDFRTHEMGEV